MRLFLLRNSRPTTASTHQSSRPDTGTHTDILVGLACRYKGPVINYAEGGEWGGGRGDGYKTGGGGKSCFTTTCTKKGGGNGVLAMLKGGEQTF